MATPRAYPFELGGADGGPLRGVALAAAGGQGLPGIVICHGFKGFREWGFFPRVAERLARAGFTVVTFNLSSSGVASGDEFTEPERFARGTFGGDLEDIATVCHAASRGTLAHGLAAIDNLGLLGHSRGGGTCVLSAANVGAAALVTWASISQVRRWDDATTRQWRRTGTLEVLNTRTGQVLPVGTAILDEIERGGERLDIARAAASITVPWLLIHGSADETVDLSEGRTLHAAAGTNARLAVIDGAGHTFGVRHPWAGTTGPFDHVLDLTTQWFVETLF